MDVSDGLAGDLAKMMRASGVSAVVEADQVPLSAAAAGAVQASPDLLDLALTGGDDYEILCTVPENKLDSFRKEADSVGIPLSVIGRVVAGRRLAGLSDERSRKTLRCRLLPAFLILPSRRLPATTPSPNAMPSCWPPPWRWAARVPPSSCRSAGWSGRLSRPNKELATLPVSLLQSRPRARHHPGRHAHAQGGAPHRLYGRSRDRPCRRLPRGVRHRLGELHALLPRHPDHRQLRLLQPELPLRSDGCRLRGLQAEGDLLGHDRRPRGRHRRASDGDLDPGCGSGGALRRRLPRAGGAGLPVDDRRLVPAADPRERCHAQGGRPASEQRSSGNPGSSWPSSRAWSPTAS